MIQRDEENHQRYSLMILKFRSLVASKELLVSESNNDIAMVGQWSRDYRLAIKEIDEDIAKIESEIV